MLIRSNAGMVLRRLRRFQEELPGALRRAAAREIWRPRLERAARETIRAQWALERVAAKREWYERLTEGIVRTFVREVFEGGVAFGLKLPEWAQRERGFDLAGAARYHLGRLTPEGRVRKYATFEAEEQKNLAAARQAVRDWVQVEKRREPGRDDRADGTPLTEDEIAERILEILGLNEGAAPRARTTAMEAAAAELTGAIEQWLEGEGENPPVFRKVLADGQENPPPPALNPALVKGWFEAVLVVWRQLLATELPRVARTEIGNLWRRIEGELL